MYNSETSANYKSAGDCSD